MTRLIIDTDPGVDDAIAIAIAALSPSTDLLGVTTVFGNVPLAKTTRNALRILEMCGRDDVPVAAGAAMPLVHPQARQDSTAHGDDGLSGHADVLPEPSRDAVADGAVGLMASLLEQAEEPVTISPIGPLTNIAVLLAAYPHLKPKIERLVIMGGALEGGNVTARAEFNVWSDPEAARRVLVTEDVPCVLVPMDLTYRCAVDTDWLELLATSGRVGEALRALTPEYVRHYTRALGWPGMVVHDAVAIVEAITPGTLVTESLPLDIECSFGPSRGAVIADRRRREQIDDTVALDEAGRVDVAMDTDIARLRAVLLEGIEEKMEA
ncbi:nucleoside hydrolase [Haloechinothrix halophila]|uniref:nucleoside hydrolase n=1 Tax=Haloechinothrix halophila TaxID=1069073 RepID=UPI00055091D2|nr:nucleoside hydrolase [Haloechinothrix halophila]